MANKTSESRNSLLSFLEVSETINSSFGAKKGINTADKSSREYQKHQSMVLRGVELLIEFTKLNPSELVEFGRKAASNTQAMADAKKTMR
nr:hypothetical protein [Candidatus Sigynarchaeota archaeon]